MITTQRLSSILMGIALTCSLLLAGCSGGAGGEPPELSTKYWYGKFNRSNDRASLALDFEEIGQETSGKYRFYGQHRQFSGVFKGEFGSDGAKLQLELPEEGALGMSELTVNLGLLKDCTPEEAMIVRRHMKNQKGVTDEILEKKLLKMDGVMSYMWGDKKESLIGFVGESIERKRKKKKKK